MAYEKERQVAVETVLRACRLCQAVRDALVSEETMAKEDRSPVTVADFGSQAVISLDLLRAFPDDPVAAEEDATDLRTPAGSALRAKVTQHVNTTVPGLSDEEILASIDRV
jgi:3'(2'), 5'-bisphosphate nucleotidase